MIRRFIPVGGIALVLSVLFSVANAAQCITDFQATSSPALCGGNYFNLIKSTWSDVKYTGWVKFVLPLKSNGEIGQILFQNSGKFDFHYDFAKTLPGFQNLTPSQFDAISLKETGRKVILGTVLFPRKQPGPDGFPTLAHYELITSENFTATQVAAVQKALYQGTTELLKELKYYPTASVRAQVMNASNAYKDAGIEIVPVEAADKKICYAEGWNVGKVRILTSEQVESLMAAGQIDSRDFLVVDKAPREIPPVAGVITGTESAPSSHVALLSQMYQIPFTYEKEAHLKESWKKLDSKVIYYRSEGGVQYCKDTVIGPESLKAEEINRLTDLKKPLVANQPAMDAAYKTISKVNGLKLSDIPRVGGKAAHFSVLVNSIPENTHKQVASIPLHYYFRFLNEAKVASGETLKVFLKTALDSIKDPATPMSKINQAIGSIQNTFNSVSIPEALVNDIETQLTTAIGGQTPLYPDPKLRLKFRSSSNAEDLDNFNGAGLYDSAAVCLADKPLVLAQTLCYTGKKPARIADALKKVWSSLYTTRGYLARRWHGISEDNVGMGILINPSVSDELANGVSIFTFNDEKLYESEVTGFPGEDLDVTKPPVGSVPETTQITTSLSFDGNVQTETKLIASSTEVPNGQTLLTSNLYTSLHNLMLKIVKAWPIPQNQKKGLKLDFEWKLVEGNPRKIVIKQVRPVPRTPTKDNLVIVGHRNFELYPIENEIDDGMATFQSRLRLRPKFALFDVKELEQGKNPLEKVEIEGRTGQIYQVIPTGFNHKAGPWSDLFSEGALKKESRRHELAFKIPFSELQSLKLNMSFEEVRFKGTANLAVSMAEVRDSGFILSFSSKEIFDRKNEPETELYTPIVDPEKRGSAFSGNGPFHKIHNTFIKDQKKIHFEGVTDCTGVCKTMFQDFEKVTISGIFSQSLIFTNPKAAVYAPSHHNFVWQYVVDLLMADNISAALKAEIAAKGGRFLVVNSNPQNVRLWTENSVGTTLIEDYEMKTEYPDGSPGGGFNPGPGVGGFIN